MDEILAVSDEVVVMRDGSVSAIVQRDRTNVPDLISRMGTVSPAGRTEIRVEVTEGRIVIALYGIKVSSGTVVGIAGLDGNGQKEFLYAIMGEAGHTRGPRHFVKGSVSFVAGDRQRDGIFPDWSIARNISIGRARGGARAVTFSNESKMAESYVSSLKIRAENVDIPVSSLSGGNQQKVLVARALAQDADIIVLDDPLRGVDIGTKRELYHWIREAAANGKTFVWYTTELGELDACDVVYVMYAGQIAATFNRGDFTEHDILAASFGPSTRSGK